MGIHNILRKIIQNEFVFLHHINNNVNKHRNNQKHAREIFDKEAMDLTR